MKRISKKQNRTQWCTRTRKYQLAYKSGLLNFHESYELVDMLVAWNWPQWECLYRRNLQTLKIRAVSSFSSPRFTPLPPPPPRPAVGC